MSLEPVEICNGCHDERGAFSPKRCIKAEICVNYQIKIRSKESGDLWRKKMFLCNINKCFHQNESQHRKMHDLIKAKQNTGDKWRIQTSKNKQNVKPQLAYTRLSAVHGTLPHFAGAQGNNALYDHWLLPLWPLGQSESQFPQSGQTVPHIWVKKFSEKLLCSTI